MWCSIISNMLEIYSRSFLHSHFASKFRYILDSLESPTVSSSLVANPMFTIYAQCALVVGVRSTTGDLYNIDLLELVKLL